MDHDVAQEFAADWYAAWNAHDLERILSHYANDVEMASPLVSALTGEADGRIVGKEALRAYFAAGLEKYPELHFEPLELFVGVSSLVLRYVERGRAALGRGRLPRRRGKDLPLRRALR